MCILFFCFIIHSKVHCTISTFSQFLFYCILLSDHRRSVYNIKASLFTPLKIAEMKYSYLHVGY